MNVTDLKTPSKEFIDELLEIIQKSAIVGADTFSIEFNNGVEIELTFDVHEIVRVGDSCEVD